MLAWPRNCSVTASDVTRDCDLPARLAGLSRCCLLPISSLSPPSLQPLPPRHPTHFLNSAQWSVVPSFSISASLAQPASPNRPPKDYTEVGPNCCCCSFCPLLTPDPTHPSTSFVPHFACVSLLSRPLRTILPRHEHRASRPCLPTLPSPLSSHRPRSASVLNGLPTQTCFVVRFSISATREPARTQRASACASSRTTLSACDTPKRSVPT